MLLLKEAKIPTFMLTKQKQMSIELKKLTLQNFKCFKENQTLDFKKLTLITGANSSGKSSLCYGILGALQSINFPYEFSTNGKYVNMGDFKDISHAHNSRTKIKFGFELYDSNEKELSKIVTEWGLNRTNSLPKLTGLSFENKSTSFFLSKEPNNWLLQLNYDPNKNESITPERKNARMALQDSIFDLMDSIEKAYPEDFENKSKKTKNKRDEKILEYIKTEFEPLPLTTIKFKDIRKLPSLLINNKKHVIFRNTYSHMRNIFREFDERVNFISSFRLHPDRTYLEKPLEKNRIGIFGEGYLDQIISWHSSKSKKYKELISIMNTLSLFYDIKPHRIGGGRYEVLLKSKEKGSLSSLTDTGFGISQFLPIIVADLQLPDSSTLYLAQPEIHLHPDAQANIGNYLVENIYNEKKNRHYVVETHSEYLLNRLRLLVVKGELKEEDLIIYYLENENNVSKIHKVTFNKKGNIVGAPKSFFKTYLMDIKNIALNV